MSPEMGRSFFRIAFFIAFVSAVLLPFLTPGTAEFVVALLTLLIGLIFIAAVIFVLRRFSR